MKGEHECETERIWLDWGLPARLEFYGVDCRRAVEGVESGMVTSGERKLINMLL